MRLVEDREAAERVIFDPEIVSDIAEDGASMDALPEGPIYLCGFVDGEIIGCFVVEKRARFSADVHVQVLPKHREQYAIQFGRDVIQWVWDNTDLMKLTAEIPTTHPNVAAYAELNGFKIEGRNRRSLLKGGKLVDQWYFGLCRGD